MFAKVPGGAPPPRRTRGRGERAAGAAAGAGALAALPNFWAPRGALEGGAAPRGPGEAACRDLLQRVMEPLLRGHAWTGAEYWVQVYRTYPGGGAGLAFHFDKDEHALASRGEMRFPLFSTVTYLAENEPGAPWLAPTVVMAQTLQGGVMTPESPERSLVAHPEHNHVLVFPGNLSHGVLDGNNKGTTRQTLLVNWWVGERPEVGVGPRVHPPLPPSRPVTPPLFRACCPISPPSRPGNERLAHDETIRGRGAQASTHVFQYTNTLIFS